MSAKEEGSGSQSLVLRPSNHITVSQARRDLPSQEALGPALFLGENGQGAPWFFFIPKGMQLDPSQERFRIFLNSRMACWVSHTSPK